MNKHVIAKRIIQTVALCFGLLGSVCIYIGVHFAIQSIRRHDPFAMSLMTPMFILLGVILVAIAWQNIRYFGPASIKSIQIAEGDAGNRTA